MMRSTNALLALSLCAGLVPGAALAASDNNGGGGGPTPLDAAVGTLAPNHGHFICTAAINANGTIASILAGGYVDAAPASSTGGTGKLSVGTYQVTFTGPCANVRIANGWFRVVQPDTLNIFSQPSRACNVADRFIPNTGSLWIQCFSGTALANTSFTVSVSR